MPGIVCAHNHFYSGLSRGIMANIAPCPDFISTLKNLWWRLDRALDEESLYYSGLICSLEAIKSGCSAVIDHHASPNFIKGSLNVLRKGFVEAGLRGMTCFETTDRNGGLAELQAGVEENILFAQQIDAAKAKGTNPIWWRPISALTPPSPYQTRGWPCCAKRCRLPVAGCISMWRKTVTTWLTVTTTMARSPSPGWTSLALSTARP